jgi:hypothetical protein
MKYYVVYTTGSTIGACTVDLELPVRNINDVILMSDGVKEIRKMPSSSTVVILSWKELEEEYNEIHQD